MGSRFDNRAKLQLFAERMQRAAVLIDSFNRQRRDLLSIDRRNAERLAHCQRLVDLEWNEIDVASPYGAPGFS
jgi:hypothetical protein